MRGGWHTAATVLPLALPLALPDLVRVRDRFLGVAPSPPRLSFSLPSSGSTLRFFEEAAAVTSRRLDRSIVRRLVARARRCGFFRCSDEGEVRWQW
ncbi:MAG: hypothetical protein J3Q66DRAFT_320962 [Benniella sp.]|nr:MAG: hypothetical protein J3Q66DRAFT_320962 [Benniella sp.]